MMAFKFSILFLITSLSACSNISSSENDLSKKKEDLLQAIEKFNQAFSESDTELLESMITDNYLHSNGASAAINKTDWVNYLHKRKQEIASGFLTVNSYEMDQIEIGFYSNSAVITARVITSTTNSRGEMNENKYRVTNLWVHESGLWKRAAFHDGRIE